MAPTASPGVKVQLTNTALQQTWQLSASAADPASGQPAHFVVLQSRPSAQSLTVLDNRCVPVPNITAPRTVRQWSAKSSRCGFPRCPALANPLQIHPA